MRTIVFLVLCCSSVFCFSQEQKTLPKSIDLVTVNPIPELDNMFTSQDDFKKDLKNYPILFKNTHFAENNIVSNQLATMLSSTDKKNMEFELDEMMFSFNNLVGIYKNRSPK